MHMRNTTHNYSDVHAKLLQNSLVHPAPTGLVWRQGCGAGQKNLLASYHDALFSPPTFSAREKNHFILYDLTLCSA